MGKFSSLAVPLTALLLACVWLGMQHRTLTTLETQCDHLRTRIATDRTTSAPAPIHDRQVPLEKRRRRLEWQTIAGYFPSNPTMSSRIDIGNVLPDPRVTVRFRQRLETMTTSEIIGALDEIATLDLPPESLAALQWTLFNALAEKDPGLALTQIAQRDMIAQFTFGPLLPTAIQAWTADNPAAAGAWFDSQIAAGKFDNIRLDGTNHSRQILESAMIATLLGASPDAAAERLAVLPEDQRGAVMRMYSMSFVAENIQAAHARLVRALVPEKDQTEAIAGQVPYLLNSGNYSSIDAYLRRIDASPAERTACAEIAARNMRPGDSNSNAFTRQDFDGLREWIARQAPDSVATLTGKALGEAAAGSRGMDFATAAKLALEYNATSSGDETLAVFLKCNEAQRHKPEARAIAGQISDESRRAGILNLLK